MSVITSEDRLAQTKQDEACYLKLRTWLGNSPQGLSLTEMSQRLRPQHANWRSILEDLIDHGEVERKSLEITDPMTGNKRWRQLHFAAQNG